jgi:hypothetical protein
LVECKTGGTNETVLFAMLSIFLCVGAVNAFEFDGFKYGMSKLEVKNVLKRFSYTIHENEEYDSFTVARGPNIIYSFGFFKGKLSILEKFLTPKFSYFARLIADKRRELGRPMDALCEVSDVTSNTEYSQVQFIWYVTDYFFEVVYSEFPTNNMLRITYKKIVKSE